MNIEIVKATHKDALKANDFLTRLIKDEKQYDANVNEEFVTTSYYEIVIKDPNNCLLVAKKEKEIIGYLYGYVMDNGTTVLKKVSRLDALFVDEANRGLKVATKLFDAFKKWSLDKECQYMEVGVFNTNVLAYNFYKNKGFKNIKTVLSLDLKD